MRVSVIAPLCLLLLCLTTFTLYWMANSSSEETRWEAEKRQREAQAAFIKAQASYDHSSPEAAMKAVIQAARNQDKQGFALGMQGDVILAALNEDAKLTSMMQEYAKLRFVKVNSTGGGKAQILVRSKNVRRLYNLIQEPDGWRVVGMQTTQALDEIALLEGHVKAMLTAAENEDFSAFKKYLSEEILTLIKTEPGSQKEFLRAFSEFSFVRIESINIQASPELGNVILSSNGREQRITYQLVDGTWRIQLPKDYWHKRNLSLEEISASASDTPKTVGISYSSPIAAFDATLAVAKVKNEQLFAKSFTDSYPSQLKKFGLTPAQAIERFLRSPEAILKFRNRTDLRNPLNAKRATLILELDEQTFEHQMILEAGQWHFVEPFFLK